MRSFTLAAALTGAIFMTGCSTLVSLNPFVTDQEAVFDRGLVGVWTNDQGDETYVIRQAGHGYSITYQASDGSVKLEAHMIEAGEAKLVDLTSTSEDPFQLPVHSMMRVWTEGNTLRISMLDSEWLRERAAQQMPTYPAGDRKLIAAPGDAVRAFLLKYGVDERAHSEPGVLHRSR